MSLTDGASTGAAGVRRFRIAATAAAAILALDAAWVVFGFGGNWTTKAWSDLVDIPVTAAAAAVCWWTARRMTGQWRRAWRSMGAGIAAWGLGECVWAFYELIAKREVPFPSLADAGYLMLIPLAAFGILSIPHAPRSATARSRMLLDALIIATSVFAVSWNLLLGQMFRTSNGDVLQQSLSVAYPLGDIVLIGAVLFVGARATRAERRTIAFIGSGLAAIAVSDTLFTYFTINSIYSTNSTASNVLGLGWTAGWMLVALGALSPAPPTRVRDDNAPSKIGAMLPYVAVVVGVPIQVVKFFQTGKFDPVVFAAGIALFVVLGIRQLLFALENRGLAHDFEIKVKERTAELERTLEKLRQAALRQEEFVAHASHELFTPLTTIVGTLELLAEPGDIPFREIPGIVEMSRQGARRMTQLVDDLLLATGLTGFIACERIHFDVTERVRAAVDGFQPFDKAIETRHVERIAAIGDAERFQSALVHVLSNADKFAPVGSTIRVEQFVGDNDVAVVVTDEGPGIPADVREDVFERFQQLDGSDTRGHEGLGLGLFLARQVIRAMGGDITIDDVSRGCAIRISLLRARTEDGTRDEPHAAAPGAWQASR